MTLAAAGCGSDDSAEGPPAPSATSNTSPTSGVTAEATAQATAGATPAPASALAGGEFTGTTACEGAKPPLPQIAKGTNCELATWSLDFEPDTYRLAVSYGRAERSGPGIADPEKVRMAGDWTETGGVVELASADPDLRVKLVRIGSDVLHVLDADSELLIGSGGRSYTLNRTGATVSPLLTAAFDEGGTPGGGVFEGRTPCDAQLRAFAPDPTPGCTTLTWKLTLRQDAGGKPAGYVSGIEGRADAKSGDWEIVRGIPGHPEAVVYRLRSGDASLSLLLVGRHHLYMLGPDLGLLVGDGMSSYTLSRSD